MDRVYLDYFGLDQAPFSITPDPAFVYLSPRHQDALAHLLYGVGQGGGGGFVQLTGEVGTGKTTLCRCLLEQIPDKTQIALILNPVLTPLELVRAICDELGVSSRGVATSLKGLVDRLNKYLLTAHAQGQRVVVVIDEAQNLSRDALEQVRLLTNLETHTDKLLQIILLGQPELRSLLAQSDLRQLAQRITARYHLLPLNQPETLAYVEHRMTVAGARQSPFEPSALAALYRYSSGVPRLINIIADRALLAAYAQGRRSIDGRLLEAAAREVQEPLPAVAALRRWPGMAALAVFSVLALLALLAVLRDGAETTGSEKDQPGKAAPNAAVTALNEPTVEPVATAGEATAGVFQQQVLSELSEAQLDAMDAAAWSGLAQAWQAPVSTETMQQACQQGSFQGYACLRFQGTWQRIQRLGLPVLLELPAERTRYALTHGLNGSEALVQMQQQQQRVQQSALAPHWLGSFLVLWPQADDWPAQLKLSDQGPAVTIVQQLAATATPAYDGGISDLYTAEFEQWVTSFQRRYGLDQDGIIGPATLLFLLAPTIQQPRLVLLDHSG